MKKSEGLGGPFTSVQRSWHRFRSPEHLAENLWFLLILAWFVYQTSWFATNMGHRIPPDEVFHLRVVQAFMDSPALFFLDPQKQDAWIGTGTQAFFFYHWLLARFVSLYALFGEPSLQVFRSLSVLCGVAYLFVFRKLGFLLCEHATARALGLLLQSSLLMFVFITSSISYDSLTNLLSIALIYLIFLYLRSPSSATFLWALVVTALGAITKITFLPLALVAWGLLALHLKIEGVRQLPSKMRSYLAQGRYARLLGLLALCALALSLTTILRAWVNYGALWPPCPAIYSPQQCLDENPVYRKMVWIGETYDVSQLPLLDPFRYGVLWVDQMIEQSLGIFGYSSFYPPMFLVSATELLLLLTLGSLLVTWKKQPLLSRYGIILAAAYLTYLCYGHNYQRYLQYGIFPRYTFLTMQGRYAFPIVSLLLLAVSRFVCSSDRRLVRGAALGVGLCTVLLFGFPDFPNRNADLTKNHVLQRQHEQQWLSTNGRRGRKL